MAAASLPLGLPSCPECRGGGEINGVPCRACKGKRRQPGTVRVSARVRARLHGWSLGMAGFAGSLVRGVPGVGGAALASACTGGIAWRVFGDGLGPWVGGLVAAGFLLMMDRNIS